MWLLSFLLGTYFGDSKKNTEGGRVKGQMRIRRRQRSSRLFRGGSSRQGECMLTYVGIVVVFNDLRKFKVTGHDR